MALKPRASLRDAGISQGEVYKAKSLYEQGTEFYILSGVSGVRTKKGLACKFIIEFENGKQGILLLGVNDERSRLCDFLRETPDGVGPCRINQAPTTNGNPYWVLEDAAHDDSMELEPDPEPHAANGSTGSDRKKAK